MSVYDFQERLDFSRGRRERSDMKTIQSMLDGCVGVEKTDSDVDRSGVDYIATLRGGAKVTVDAKTREKGCSKYWRNRRPELALEKWSVVPTGQGDGVVGWTLCESKEVDLIFFKFHPSDCETVFLFSYQLLRIAFRRQCTRWYEIYKTGRQHTRSRSRSWHSECVFVPVPVVEKAIRDARRAKLRRAKPKPKATGNLFGPK